jgi:hypothetical protein
MPSVGGPIVDAAGVPGFESDAFSPFEAGAAKVADVAGDSCDSLTISLTGESSLTDSTGSIRSRSLWDGTCKVTVMPFLPPDLRRLTPTEFDGAMVYWKISVAWCSGWSGDGKDAEEGWGKRKQEVMKILCREDDG